MPVSEETLDFDLLIVGAGPAGLAAAIRARQLALAAGENYSVCLLDKGAEVGAHILSGAVIDPVALDELLPDWRSAGAPLRTQVTDDRFLLLGESRHWQLPHALLPACLHNRGLYLGSLGDLCRWLAQQAEALGVDVFPGFAAAEFLHEASGAVCGVRTGASGVLRDGSHGPGYQPGTKILARHTLLAEGARGHLGKQAEAMFDLRKQANLQTFSLGIKELWRVPASQHQPGLAIHVAGWPLGNTTSGGAFCYHYGEGLVSLGLIAGLEYSDARFSPYAEFQRLKTHPVFQAMLANGECLAYGARVLATGGWQSLPELNFPGGALTGDDAGMLDASRNKGVHTAMKSGMLAAEAALQSLTGQAHDYPAALRKSWLGKDLYRARNFKPALKRGLLCGSLLAGIEQKLLGAHAPWTLRNRADYLSLKPLSAGEQIAAPDRSHAVFLSNTRHAEDQPCHLQLFEPAKAITLNHAVFASPETRYCPAGVYEIIEEAQGPRLQINAANCLHCKACDIKDPGQNINWLPPQGGEGPIYSGM